DEEVVQKIFEKFSPRLLAITLGAEGMLLAEDGKILQTIPTAAREVFDVSGAGDTVIASLSVALAAGQSFVQAAEFANLAAGVVVGKVGTASVSPAEILDLLP
ncbi:MAG: PfkB family carbohydrate kinase, partial [Opitutales bacterium]